jgi:hypothetical protein
MDGSPREEIEQFLEVWIPRCRCGDRPQKLRGWGCNSSECSDGDVGAGVRGRGEPVVDMALSKLTAHRMEAPVNYSTVD